MNSNQAKSIPLTYILSRLGYKPIKYRQGGNDVWYNSPFRNEIEPSFHIHVKANMWNDFGDTGGNVLDFVMRYKNTDVKGALGFLENLFHNADFKPYKKPKEVLTTLPAKQSETLLLKEIKPLNDNSNSGKALLQYLTGKRSINPEIAKKYLSEIQYINTENEKHYFAAGIQNISGGYEIRNPYFKSSLLEKNLSHIKGKVGDNVYIFEGFIDFLSALTHFQQQDLAKFQNIIQNDTIILNSTSFVSNAIEILKTKNYTSISLFLDNDITGKNTAEEIIKAFPIAQNQSQTYADFKDFNEFLLKKL
jgi:hypothetical protein